jgi:hypothetical protein
MNTKQIETNIQHDIENFINKVPVSNDFHITAHLRGFHHKDGTISTLFDGALRCFHNIEDFALWYFNKDDSIFHTYKAINKDISIPFEKFVGIFQEDTIRPNYIGNFGI